MSNRDNQNKRDAGQTQQKENRENSQQNQNKAQKETASNSPGIAIRRGRRPAVFLLERRAYRRMNWRFTSTLPPIPATEHLLEYCQ